MGQKYLMAVDAGTGSVRAVLFDTEGNQIGVSQQEWFHREDPRWPGSMDFDWVHNWELASGCIRDVLAARDNVSVPEIAMRYIFGSPMNVYAVVSTTSAERLQMNIRAAEQPLSPEDCLWLEQGDAGHAVE